MKTTKTRISISIDPKVLQKLDTIVGETQASRSDAIEKIINKYVSEKKKCVLLAGGPPENLKVGNTFRPLIKVKGKTIVEWSVEKAKKAGYNDIVIIGSKEVLSEIFKVLGESSIEYIEEKEFFDTAKTLQLAKDKVKSTFLFIPCDHYFEIDLKEMETYHRLNQGICTLAVYSGTDYEWKKSSIVNMQGNTIIDYKESPKINETHLTSLMIGFAETEIFDSIPKAKIAYSLQKDVFTELAKQKKLVGYLYSGKWKNIHSVKDAAGL